MRVEKDEIGSRKPGSMAGQIAYDLPWGDDGVIENGKEETLVKTTLYRMKR